MVQPQLKRYFVGITRRLSLEGFPSGTVVKKFTCQCRRGRRHRFDP